MLEALERYGANLKALDAAGNSALDILVGGESCFGQQTNCLDKEELLQAIEFLMEHQVEPKEKLEGNLTTSQRFVQKDEPNILINGFVVDREERLDRETREKIKELIARRQARQWMQRIDRDLQEIRDTRSAIQNKLFTIEATLVGTWLSRVIWLI